MAVSYSTDPYASSRALMVWQQLARRGALDLVEQRRRVATQRLVQARRQPCAELRVLRAVRDTS